MQPEGSIAVYGADCRLCVNPNPAHLETALEAIEMVGMSSALDESLAEELIYELLRSPGQIPNQGFSLHFNTWEGIRNVCREIAEVWRQRMPAQPLTHFRRQVWMHIQIRDDLTAHLPSGRLVAKPGALSAGWTEALIYSEAVLDHLNH